MTRAEIDNFIVLAKILCEIQTRLKRLEIDEKKDIEGTHLPGRTSI